MYEKVDFDNKWADDHNTCEQYTKISLGYSFNGVKDDLDEYEITIDGKMALMNVTICVTLRLKKYC